MRFITLEIFPGLYYTNTRMKKISLLGILEKHLELPATFKYHCINGLSDVKYLKHKDIVLTDATGSMCKFIGLLSSYMLVAPVCRQREEKIIRIYGEKEQVKLFYYIIDKIQKYENDNGLINLIKVAKLYKIRNVSPRAYYLRERAKVYEWLSVPERWGFMRKWDRIEYQYKLIYHVSKLENLIPSKYQGRDIRDFDLGWHVSCPKFQNKKILTTKCLKGVN